MEAFGILNQIWNLIKVIRNSKKEFVRPKQLIWTGGTDRQTHTQTDTQTDPCIELRYAQLKMSGNLKAEIFSAGTLTGELHVFITSILSSKECLCRIPLDLLLLSSESPRALPGIKTARAPIRNPVSIGLQKI